MTTTTQQQASNDIIRAALRGREDLQKLRIEFGNRIAANFRAKLELDPDTSEDDAKDVLKTITRRYELITEGVIEISRRRKYEFDALISNFAELSLVSHYLSLRKQELRADRELGGLIKEHPLWVAFLDDIRGLGPITAGVLLSEVDISKAKYPSSLFRYAGLDVSTTWKLQSAKTLGVASNWQFDNQTPLQVEGKIPDELRLLARNDDPHHVHYIHENGDKQFYSDGSTSVSAKMLVQVDDKPIKICTYALFHSGGRSRRKEHLVDVQYTNTKGEQATRKSITFNPYLKTKLTGVFAPCLIKAGGKYKDIYDAYKHRIENHPNHVEKTKAHRHNMAMRYMVKMFLIDLYNAWRELENLPIAPPYHEAKLGIFHGKNNDQSAN